MAEIFTFNAQKFSSFLRLRIPYKTICMLLEKFSFKNINFVIFVFLIISDRFQKFQIPKQKPFLYTSFTLIRLLYCMYCSFSLIHMFTYKFYIPINFFFISWSFLKYITSQDIKHFVTFSKIQKNEHDQYPMAMF